MQNAAVSVFLVTFLIDLELLLKRQKTILTTIHRVSLTSDLTRPKNNSRVARVPTSDRITPCSKKFAVGPIAQSVEQRTFNPLGLFISQVQIQLKKHQPLFHPQKSTQPPVSDVQSLPVTTHAHQ
jgi:hypothetical protein